MLSNEGFFAEHEARIRSAMVIYALEKSLARFALSKDLQSDLVEHEQGSVLLPRFRSREGASKIERPRVEDLYLEEVFQYAERVVKGTANDAHLRRLRSLCEGLELFELRNAVSHPTRAFPACYWYRSAAIASDPSVLLLGLNDVTESLARAEAGNIQSVPEEWISDKTWSLPSRLPATLEHQSTSLIGREQEREKLLQLLQNRRLSTIAIVAPGGTGKTALTLDVLHELTLLPDTQDWLDGLMFLSLKQEMLTESGIRPVDAPSTLDDLKRQCAVEISRLFEQAPIQDLPEVIDLYGEERLILCFDNLETILRDYQEQFVEFCNALPSFWRVLITSRVVVEGAHTFSISSLRRPAAIHLGRAYGNVVGIGTLPEDALSRIADESGGNPLAIRLMIDRLALGHELPVSISSVASDVAEFSYRTLMDVLDDTDVEFLECLFARGGLSRGEICGFLGVGLDEISERIARVTKTSLVARSVSGGKECYELTGAVRRLVLLHPRNIAIRERVAKRIAQGRARAIDVDVAQRGHGVDRFDQRYIPSDTPDELKALCGDSLKVLFRRTPDPEKVAALQRRFNFVSERYGSYAVFHRFFARILSSLNDIEGAKHHLRLAIDASSEDVLARAELSKLLSVRGHDFEAGLEVAMSLYIEGWWKPENSNSEFARQVNNNVYIPLLYLGKYDEILRLTEGWEVAGEASAIMGVYRASAFKRSAEYLSPYDGEELVPLIDRSVAVLQRVMAIDGVFAEAMKQARNLAEDIAFRLEWGGRPTPLLPRYAKSVLGWLKFLDSCLPSIYGDLPVERRDRIARVFAGVALEGNPFHLPRWVYVLGPREDRLAKLKAEGYLSVTVSAVPNTGGSQVQRFMFAVDENNESYYLNFMVFEPQDPLAWARLRVGDKLAIIPGPGGADGKAIPAKRIVLPVENSELRDQRWAPLAQWRGA